ncbi:MAG: DUF3301 domain-containing protein [Gammaproteobacteria bacterium]|nr:DUF3301 domain-containing protein [Gammaproteobacteria bacterium]
MTALFAILLICAAIWFWLDSARAREIAVGICRHGCEERGLQFLDQTVALARLGVRWTNTGIRFRRLFRFDFSEEGMERRSGHVTLVGIQLEEFSLGLPSPPDNVVPFQRKPSNTLH